MIAVRAWLLEQIELGVHPEGPQLIDALERRIAQLEQRK